MDLEKIFVKLRTEYERLLNENGFVIFVDGYDENNNPIHKQIYKTYKESNKELIAENRKFKQQLKEKDEEIRELKEVAGCENCREYTIHKVCDKFRKGIDDIHFNGNQYGYIGLCETHELIDKIARGEV